MFHEAVNLLFCAYIDAAGGFIQQQHAGAKRQPFAKDDLLLVAAREKLHRLAQTRGFHVQVRNRLLCHHALAAAVQETGARILSQGGQSDILPHRHFKDDALLFPVLGHEGQPRADRGSGGVNAPNGAVHPDLATARGFNPEQHAQQLRAPCADQPGNADNFPAVQRKADFMLWEQDRTQPSRFQGGSHGGLYLNASFGAFDSEIAADHQPNQAVVGHLVARQFARVFSITQDHHAIGEFLYLTEPVRNIDNADAARAQVLDHPE